MKYFVTRAKGFNSFRFVDELTKKVFLLIMQGRKGDGLI